MHLALNKSRLDYKWIILEISFLMEFIALGFCSSNMGLFTVPVTDALGIDRLAYSLSISIRYGIQVIVALFYGSLMNRFGAYDLSGSINELGNVFGENTIDLIKQAVTKLKANDKYVGLSTGDSSEKTLILA